MDYTLYHGDCLAVLPTLPANSVDAIVTDPPYGLAFMGKDWDHGVPGVHFWTEALRVAKPGAHLLAFGGSRTYHRLAVAIEDAGWEIRDTIMWLYGSGFPKSHNLDGDWQGWGTALKPAHEPIIVARKPLAGTVAGNVLAWGTGAINVDGCRVGPIADTRRSKGSNPSASSAFPHSDDNWTPHVTEAGHVGARWPANVVHDGSAEVTRLFPVTTSGKALVDGRYGQHVQGKDNDIYGKGLCSTTPNRAPIGDTGSAARFFYCAKASKADRDEGLEGWATQRIGHNLSTNACARCGMRVKANGSGAKCECGELRETIKLEAATRNHHPTVKPTLLMRWLVRLVTPPNGVILDPFTGSGSTGKAAMLEGARFIGIEQDAEYCEIARARIGYAVADRAFGLFDLPEHEDFALAAD